MTYASEPRDAYPKRPSLGWLNVCGYALFIVLLLGYLAAVLASGTAQPFRPARGTSMEPTIR